MAPTGPRAESAGAARPQSDPGRDVASFWRKEAAEQSKPEALKKDAIRCRSWTNRAVSAVGNFVVREANVPLADLSGVERDRAGGSR